MKNAFFDKKNFPFLLVLLPNTDCATAISDAICAIWLSSDCISSLIIGLVQVILNQTGCSSRSRHKHLDHVRHFSISCCVLENAPGTSSNHVLFEGWKVGVTSRFSQTSAWISELLQVRPDCSPSPDSRQFLPDLSGLQQLPGSESTWSNFAACWIRTSELLDSWWMRILNILSSA